MDKPAVSSWRRSALALVAALSLLGSACSGDEGGADAQAFASSYRSVTTDLQAQVADAKSRAELTSTEGLDSVIGVYQQILDSTAAARTELEGLDPPDDLESSFEEMLALLAEQESALSELVVAAGERDITAVTAAASRLNELTSEWNQVRAEVENRLQ